MKVSTTLSLCALALGVFAFQSEAEAARRCCRVYRHAHYSHNHCCPQPSCAAPCCAAPAPTCCDSTYGASCCDGSYAAPADAAHPAPAPGGAVIVPTPAPAPAPAQNPNASDLRAPAP